MVGGYFHVVSCLVFFLKSRHVKRKEWLSRLNERAPEYNGWQKGEGVVEADGNFPPPKRELPLHVVTKR